MLDDVNELDIMKIMEHINYGWIDRNNKKHTAVDENFSDNYILQSPEDVIKSQVGVCWDQVELERYYFERSCLNIKTFFIVHYDKDRCPTHTFLTYEKDGKHYWFEHSWELFRGIHEYDSHKDLLIDVRNKFIKFELKYEYDARNLMLNEYKKPEFHISVQAFYKHCENSKIIELKSILAGDYD